jgi:GMP synthase (glutamine-hydrolysing)
LPEDFELLATSESGHPAAILGGKILAVQFHPEVAHTENGIEILKFFAQEICDCSPNWGSRQMLDYIYEQIQEQVGSQDHILCALSGGVDSTVASVLLTKLFGADRVHCVFVDNGLLRKDEFTTVLEHYKQLGLNVKGINASDKFLTALRGVVDPEIKRKKIGQLFIEVFDQTVREMGLDQVQFLAQGTLYPDVIESASPWGGPSVTIKSHHNVGGLPEKMKLKLVEPLRWLFKDEVRTLGRQLGIPEPFLQRHPFPGPGLGIRVVGEVTQDKLNILKDVDAIFTEELRKAGLYEQIWQAFAVLLPVRAVGVQGDERSYEWTAVLRAVTSVDGMTADWFSFGPEFMRKVSNRITNEVARVNRVLYDVTSKPPGTIEWE